MHLAGLRAPHARLKVPARAPERRARRQGYQDEDPGGYLGQGVPSDLLYKSPRVCTSLRSREHVVSENNSHSYPL